MSEQYYNDIFRTSRPVGQIHRGMRRPFSVLVLLVMSFALVAKYRSVNVRSESINHPRSPLFSSKKKVDETTLRKNLLENMRKALDETVGTYSVYIYDLDTAESFGLNEHTVFEAASLTKVTILTTLYSLSEAGTIDLDKTVTVQEEDIQNYGSGQLRYDGAGKTFTIKTLARLMMEKSDNTAAYIIGSQLVGQKRLIDDTRRWGLEQTDIAKNQTSNFDMAILMRKVFSGEIVNKVHSKEMLDFMQQTDYEDRIPAELPNGTIVYHKTGDQVSVSHDIGIVSLPHANYYLGIMTSNMLANELEVKASMAQVSKMVFDYYTTMRED